MGKFASEYLIFCMGYIIRLPFKRIEVRHNVALSAQVRVWHRMMDERKKKKL